MMANLDFSEEEIQEQLTILGYKNISKDRLHEFKQDLDELIRHGKWKSLTSPPPVHSTKSHTAAFQPSLPAYTKEKVSLSYTDGPGEGFFLHAGNVDHDRQVLTTCQNRDYRWSQSRNDSYAQHSVAPKLRLPPGAPSRLQVESDPEDTLYPPHTDSHASTPDTLERRFIKRKVLRKHKGQSLVCDESVYSEDSDATSFLEERLGELHLSARHDDSETENEDVRCRRDSHSSESDEISTGVFESYIRGMAHTHSDHYLRPKPKSFIRPVMKQQTIKKSDPVAKYFQYKQLWEMCKLPGETDRRGLRMEIKERLAYQPPPPKPRRVYVRNTYTVPTEKKRSALRWEIRNDMANGLLPYKFNYRF
ncbi:centriolar and ciliogenesis-associated protein HYLS1 [Scomber scombrus]|uniref:centriolar and ciliogenesis-associated protein HYLS1 n=1 Tax=Scomber scombrus TaxID=13677 RepID=UPI002DDB1692|nr:centriolar and ciliogenesis-associated protein HYLS1 [Scomber scombrus]